MKQVILSFCFLVLGLTFLAAIKPNKYAKNSSPEKIELSNPLQVSGLKNTYSLPKSKYLPGKVVIKLISATAIIHSKEGYWTFSNFSTLEASSRKFGIQKIEKIFPLEKTPIGPNLTDLSTIYEISFDPAFDPLQVAEVLAADENVEYAEPHFLYTAAFTPNDSLYNQQFHIPLIEADRAWDITTGSKNVVIGIVDIGIDWHHPDLFGNVWQNLGEDADGDGHTIEFDGTQWVFDPGDLNGIDDDDFDGNPNTFIDDLAGWDVANDDNEPVHGGNHHGTFVAGVAAATTNNRVGVAGVGFNCKFMPVKVASDGQDFIDFGFAGIKYAVDAGADIINLSWGGGPASSFGLDVINYAYEHGVVLVASAGNLNDEDPFYPAAYPHVVSVASTSSSDRKAGDSNYGFWVDMSAPGVSIFSTDGGSGYRTWSGTSFSSPVVAGVAALIKSKNPNWSADQISEQVRVSSDNIDSQNSGFQRKLGFGRVNAYRALTTNSPAIRISEVNVSDHLGDGDGIIDGGEVIEMIVSVINNLETARDVAISIEEDDVNITLLSQTANLGTVSLGQTVDNSNNPFQFKVAGAVASGRIVEFILNIEANDGAYQDWEPFYLTIEPLHADHDAGNVIFTITSFGAMGYYEYVKKDINIGNGFQYPKGSPSALFHGSFMVGTDTLHVSDVAYGNNDHDKYDWVTDPNGELVIQDGIIADQEGTARFNDSIAENPIGILVTQHSYAYANPPYDDFVIMEYTVENTNEISLNGVYTAIYMDWDILEFADDEVGFDKDLALGYMYDTASKYYGISLLSPDAPASYRAIKNSEDVFSLQRFSDSKKFQFMTDGFQRIKSDEPDDWSHMLSAGPFALQPEESVTVAYVVLGGEDLEDLRSNVRAAQAVYFSSKLSTLISGKVKYFIEQRPVVGTEITLNGLSKDFTDNFGSYNFTNAPLGTNRLSAKKEGDHRNAVSGADALFVLQNLAFLRTLDPNQSKAADVTQDSQVNGSDALAIQKFLAFLQNNAAHTAQWLFSPADTSVALVDVKNVDFTAYVLGDITGDWGKNSNSILTPHGESSVLLNKTIQVKATVKLPENTSGDPGSVIPVPIKVSTDSTIGLAQFVVEYDSSVIRFRDANIGSDVVNFVSQVNTDLPFSPSGMGTNDNVLVQISGGATNTFTGSEQEVVTLNFDVVDDAGAQSPLIFDKGEDRTFLTTNNLFDLKGVDIEFVDGLSTVTPVELISFAGFVDGNHVELVWETATESNNFGFEVERSRDDKSNYEKIAFIEGAGTAVIPYEYRYVDENLASDTYFYRLKQFDTNGTFEYLGEVQVEITVPKFFALHQNYPNPFNPDTKISYELPEPANVIIKIFDMLGQEVRTLVEQHYAPGKYSAIWDGADSQGKLVASGIYVYRFQAKGSSGTGNFVETRKMLLLK